MVNRVDLHVGKRIRHRRWVVGMSQEELGKRVGVKFQQIQKYETGKNRISASRLWELSVIMDVPIAYFFDGLNVEPAQDISVYDTFLEDYNATSFVTGFYRIPEKKRKAILDFARALASPQPSRDG